MLALEALASGQPVQAAYNLGNGQGFSVQEVIATAAAVTGRQIPVQVGARRPGDPPCLVGDATAIQRDLNWQPRYADLAEILQTAWCWHQRRPYFAKATPPLRGA